MCPGANVVHVADDALPQEPADHPDFWRIWRDLVLAHCPSPDRFFASEPYGQRMAEELKCEFVPVDVARELVSVSGTAVRADPMRHWGFLPEPVRPYFARKVCVFGPESTGKSTLARHLAAEFDTLYVHEYARPLLDRKGGRCDEADLPRIARGQAAAEDALLRQCNRVLVTDTDCLTTAIWSGVLFGRVDPLVERLAERTCDLYLLCDVDVPWVDDAQRFLSEPAVRTAMFDKFRDALISRGRPFVEVRGDWGQRNRVAAKAVRSVIMRP